MPFRRLPGAARQYQNTETGQILSRRQYDKMQELLGARSHFDLPRLALQRRAQKRYNDLVDQFAGAQIEAANRQLA